MIATSRIYLVVAFCYLMSITLCYGQEINHTKHKKWGIKAGLSYNSFKVMDSPHTGSRGNGCSIGHRIEGNTQAISGNFGFFFQEYIGKRSSIIFGPEVVFSSSKLNYTSSLVCLRGMLRYESKGTLEPSQFIFWLPVLFRYETLFLHTFLEIGAYHDLFFGNSTVYNFAAYEYYENFQLLPEPKISTGQEYIQGSNYGVVLGLGNGLLSEQSMELRLQYYMSLSKNIPLDDYWFLRQSSINLSANYRF